MYETECDDIFAAFGVRVSMNIMTGICYLIKFPTKQSFFYWRTCSHCPTTACGIYLVNVQ